MSSVRLREAADRMLGELKEAEYDGREYIKRVDHALNRLSPKS